MASMETIHISTVPGYEQWRDGARLCLENNITPDKIYWRVQQQSQDDLFAVEKSALSLVKAPEKETKRAPKKISISKQFMALSRAAICHKSPDRFSLCYRVLWRLLHEDKNLLYRKTDDDVMRLNKLVKAVHRDAYKITAFLRFRSVDDGSGAEHFVAWYEPEHYTLELKIPFFKKRFKNMKWSILTPYRAAHWDMNKIVLEDNPDPSVFPSEDQVEKYWLTYYANIFNPARPKKGAMLSQMPKKYWKNMPETKLIDGLLRSSDEKVRKMIERQNS